MVFDDDGLDPALLHKLHHFFKSGTLEVCTRVAIIREEAQIAVVVLRAVYQKKITLVQNAGAVALVFIVL